MRTRSSAAQWLMALVGTAGVTVTIFSPAIASAQGSPSVVGKKYLEASQTLANAGYTVEVSNRMGDRITEDDCLVASQRDSTKPFTVGGDKTVLLSLNCNAVLSAASPEGRRRRNWQ